MHVDVRNMFIEIRAIQPLCIGKDNKIGAHEK